MEQTIFFTADHHFGHANIIRFSDRPFDSVEAMDEALIAKWNEKVGRNDSVYHLGDIALARPERTKEILDQLNGNIFLVKGNHDKSALSYPKRFEWIKDYCELNVADAEAPDGRQKIILFHYAMKVWRSSFRGTWHLYGHSHGHLFDDPTSRSFDVGVDCHNYAPLSYDDVKAIIRSKNWVAPFGNREE